MTKSLSKLGIEGNFLNLMKSIYIKKKKKTNLQLLNGEKLKAFSLRWGAKQGCPHSPFVFNIILKVLAIKQEEKERKAYRLKSKK